MPSNGRSRVIRVGSLCRLTVGLLFGIRSSLTLAEGEFDFSF